MHLRKRVLVTGGAGFLGSFLCERLLQEDCDVICCDNFFTGPKRNIAHLLSDPAFELIRHDITFPLYIEVDEIYNLACPASPIHYQNDPVQTTKVNVHGSINMLGLAKRVKARILQASTSEVYGDPSVTLRPRTTGATSTPSARAPATTRASAAPRRCSSTTTASTSWTSRWCGSSTPTGRACTPTTAGSSATSSCRRSRPGHHDLRGRRADPLLLLRRRFDRRPVPDDEHPACLHRPGQPRQPARIHHSRARRKGDPAHRVALEDRVQTASHGRPDQRRPDITLARQKLGWQPVIELEEGLQRTIEYFKSFAADEPSGGKPRGTVE